MKNGCKSLRSVTVSVFDLGPLSLLLFLVAGGNPNNAEQLSPRREINADNLPIVIVTEDSHSHKPGKVLAVYPDLPNHVVPIPTGNIGPVSGIQWTEDRTCLLVTTLKGLFLIHFNRNRQSFAPPVTVANPDVDNSFRWPAGYTKPESDIENNLRLKVKRSLKKPASAALTWSPDRSHIAFTIDSRDVADNAGEVYEDLWVAEVAGLQLKHFGHGSHPHWSPDGRSLIAIEGSVVGGKRIVRYESANGNKLVLRSGNLMYFSAAVYNPAGTSIAVFGTSNHSHVDENGIFLMDRNGRMFRKLVALKKIGSVTYPLELAW